MLIGTDFGICTKVNEQLQQQVFAAAQQQTIAAQQRANQLTERLRALGIDPDQV